MKKIFLTLMVLSQLLFSESNESVIENYVSEIMVLDRDNAENFSLSDVKEQNAHFKKITDKTFKKGQAYWIKVRLASSMKSGRYMMLYGPMDFVQNSFSKRQDVLYTKINGSSQKMIFTYLQGEDSLEYYFLLKPFQIEYEPFVIVREIEQFYNDLNEYLYYLLFCGVILGLIFMAALYNLFVYYYNRESQFLYYAVMQIFMISFLAYFTGMIPLKLSSYLVYEFVGLGAAFFATLFTRSFFNTKITLPIWDKLLVIYLVLLAVDMINLFITHSSYISDYRLFSVFSLFYLVVAFLRLKEGFRPAKFFLIGWGVFVLSLIATEYVDEANNTPMLLFGSPIEAIFLAIALAYKVKLIKEEQESQRELLIHQSKLASMGEMLGNIAHQWRQPLTHLSYIVMNIEDAFKHKSLDEKYMVKKVDEANSQIDFMSQTIEDFRDFYAPIKRKENFSIAEETEHILEIMKHILEEKDIEVRLLVKEDSVLKNYKNGYKQVMLNLLTNAKDALIENHVLNPCIEIMIEKEEVRVYDNAGGIEADKLQKIFEPYFTSKEKSLGIGLYMSKMIVEKSMEATLSVENTKKGACFKMVFKV